MSDFVENDFLNPNNWVEEEPIETLNLKPGDFIAGVYLGRESRGMQMDSFSGQMREAFVHVFENPITKKKQACWDKGGINYALKTRSIHTGDVIRLLRVENESGPDGQTYSRFNVFKQRESKKR